MANTFYWHDYETWGSDPRRDRAAQFAGVRTDQEFRIIGAPLVLYCRPADDMLPHPEACLVTGIRPQEALRDGVPEAEFFRLIHGELARPGTCALGYNSIRFDDEFTRYGLYRNFLDPYAREWQNGNSRWDIIDMVRLTRALRPEGIQWPDHPDGKPSFRLEDLSRANGIEHGAAHDALSDVHATIALARLIKARQPRLYDYVYRMRGKRQAAQLLDLSRQSPVLHLSSMYPAAYCGLAMVVPVARHPINNNGVLVFDLRDDPTPMLDLEAHEIHRRLFTPADELPEGMERIPLKTVHLNKCPVVVPMNTLTPAAAERLSIDPDRGMRHLETIRGATNLDQKIQRALERRGFEADRDPDHGLYGGGFFGDEDRDRIADIRRRSAHELIGLAPPFEDPRLPKLLFRYRARNWPQTLSPEERARWREYRHRRLTDTGGGASITLDEYRARLAALREDPDLSADKRPLLDALAAYADELVTEGEA